MKTENRIKSKWIHFDEDLMPPKGKKTKTFFVMTNQSNDCIGQIAWYGRWRQYAFFPENNTVYEPRCLQDIANFITSEMIAWKINKELKKTA